LIGARQFTESVGFEEGVSKHEEITKQRVKGYFLKYFL
jgi:hypothetical protein